MGTAISQFTFVASKKEAAKFAANIINDVKEGLKNPIDVQKTLNLIELVCKQAGEGIAREVLSEAMKYPPAQQKENNFSVCEAGIKYDFSECDDIVINSLLAQAEKLEVLIKERKEFLKTIPENSEIFGEDGAQLKRASKSSKTIVKFMLK